MPERLQSVHINVLADGTTSKSHESACRLYERRKKMEAKLAAVRAAAEHPVDPTTGRPFFQPATGRAPHYRRNQHGLPVGDYLYGMRSVLLQHSVPAHMGIHICHALIQYINNKRRG